MSTSITRGLITGAALFGLAITGGMAAAQAAPTSPDDPACAAEPLSPICSGGPYVPFGQPSSGQMVPNVDGGLSLPGTPGAI
ncbi:hypothetical protein [Mycolicibacterium bacteremicum]|uniref:hypothetical protein n=1 Tax=Mycolicibacterium bacteremicum TaxID=564198 RepID=UPI0026EA824B|nr:hypothetical protein [Mycolicibacterium bacteremicum]